jgi:aryl-alcohol dehydrogenase-like predicted oxidoreductase
MDYHNLGRTGVKVSALCLGTMNSGGRASEADSITIIAHALNAGINFIDTANIYGHDPHSC